MRGDDVRSSLDLLDRVIGEFDDGLISSTESESPISRHNSRFDIRQNEVDDDRESFIEAEIRRQPPPKGRKFDQVPPATRRTTLNEQIEDIFSELHDEIYPPNVVQVDPRRKGSSSVRPPTAVAPKTDTTSQWVAKHRQRSPVRRMDDPLPSPPLPPPVVLAKDAKKDGKPTSNGGAVPKVKDEVVIYTMDRQDSNAAELFSIKKSVNVKAQIHSLEAKTKPSPGSGSKDTKNAKSRSRSENPPLSRTSVTVEPPPPMPEKIKIHLKNNTSQSMERQSSSQQTPSSGEKMKRSPYGRYDKGKKSTPNSAISSAGKLAAKTSASTEVTKLASSVEPETRQQQIRRARSVGPVVEAAQRELSHLDLSKVLSGAPPKAGPGHADPDPPPSKERRSRSRGRTENNTSGAAVSNIKGKASVSSSGSGGRHESRLKSDFLPDRKSATRSPAPTTNLGPRSGKMPSRQKSMIDLREPFWDSGPRHMVHPIQVGRIPANVSPIPPQVSRSGPPPALVRSATEHDIRLRPRRVIPGPTAAGPASMAPFHELPPHIRQHMIRQHGFRLGEATSESLFALDQISSSLGRKGDDPFLSRQLEAQREFLIRRGFSPTHPYISGEVLIHPELQGQLPFNVPSRTIPMRPEDYRRFKPELWLGEHNPNPVAFNDLAVLQSELELRRRREIYRQSSQRRIGGDTESNFTSLPWDEIIPRRQMEQFQHQLQQHMIEQQQQQQMMMQQQEQLRGRPQDPRKKNRPFSLFGGSGWFNPTQVLRESEPLEMSSSRVKKQGHWLLKERSPTSEEVLHSMPPMVIGSLKDSGIGADDPEVTFTRSGEKRSSFGMALKDKFQRNPNMYFPPDGRSSATGARASSSGSGGSGSARGSRNGTGDKIRSTSVTATGVTASKSTSLDDLSDTDTLIHNMSEGSFEKDRASLASSAGGHNSLGSASGKGSRSSGNSSLSPHNSMEGSPRMRPRQAGQFQPASSAGASLNQSASSTGISLSKKTIRNYTPQASSNMLKEFEDRRNNSIDWRKGDKESKRSASQPAEVMPTTPSNKRVFKTSKSHQEERHFDMSDATELYHTDQRRNSSDAVASVTSAQAPRRSASNANAAKRDVDDKSAVERMMEDFHRNLPPPPPLDDTRQQKPIMSTTKSSTSTATRLSTESTLDQTAATSTTTASSSKRTSKHGTLSSQISNWSAVSSVASFDYQPARFNSESHSVLPALTEVEYVSNGDRETPISRSRNQTPKGERVPPEGASADSPQPFVQRIEIGPSKRADNPSSGKILAGKSKSSSALDEVQETNTDNNEPADEFSNLRKLISEGRISGLSDKPPSFVPPTPPAIKRVSVGGGRKETALSNTGTSGLEKKPSRSAADRPRKSREAPKPPTESSSKPANPSGSVQPVNPDIKLLNNRHRESLEDLTQMESRRSRSGNAEIKRSSSNHGVRPSGFDTRSSFEETTAQLIADSTERKFNFNPFKGMWKKKHYSFDFN